MTAVTQKTSTPSGTPSGGYGVVGEADTKVTRLFGPPGTGKTTTLSRRIAESAAGYSGLVAVTSFTRTAALELRGRELPIAENRVGTLHSMAFRAIGASREQILDKNKELRDAWNEEAPAGWALAASGVSVDDPLAERAEDDDGAGLLEYQVLRQRCEEIPEWLRSQATFYEHWKRAHDCLDFTDLIAHCVRDELGPPIDVAIWYHDETQDSTPLELALLRQWSASCPGGLTLAGDDQQAIYGFRGATPHAFLEGAATEEVLGQSYRLPEVIRSFAHDYGSEMEYYRRKDWVGQDREGAVTHGSARLDCPETVIEDIETEFERGSETVLVLATCSYMLRRVLAELRDAAIPFANPYRPTRGDWNPLRGGMGKRIARFLKDDMTWKDAWSWIDLLDTKKVGMQHGSKKLLSDAIFDADDDFGESKFTLWTWESIVGDCAVKPGDLQWLREHVTAKHRSALDYPSRVIQAHGVQALEDDPKVIVGTVHSVKGGEADSVLLFPDISKKAWAASHDDPDDLKRTFYVGMTRARRRLVLCERSSRYFESW